MEYREFEPAAELKPYVRCYWTLRSTAPIESEPVLPDGRFELVFQLADPFIQIRNGSRAIQPHSALIADLRKPVTIQPSGRAEVFGVRFHAGGAYPFFRAPLRELEGESDRWTTRGPALRKACVHALAKPPKINFESRWWKRSFAVDSANHNPPTGNSTGWWHFLDAPTDDARFRAWLRRLDFPCGSWSVGS